VESSDYLYHFTKSRDTLKSIVQEGFWVPYSCEDVSFLKNLSDEIDWDRVWDEMMAGGDIKGAAKQKHEGDLARNDDGDRYKVYIPMVCFCDIPHTRLENHAGEDDDTDYNPYAIALEKEWGRQRGVNPVTYVVPESGFATAFQNFEALTDSIRPECENWQFRSVFRKLLQFLKPYNDGEKRYYDEREWRFIPSGKSRLYSKSAFEVNEIANPRPLPIAPEDIECLIVNHKSEVEDVKTFLNQGLNGDAEEIEVRTFQRVKERGIE
jgi:hypothetical protein